MGIAFSQRVSDSNSGVRAESVKGTSASPAETDNVQNPYILNTHPSTSMQESEEKKFLRCGPGCWA